MTSSPKKRRRSSVPPNSSRKYYPVFLDLMGKRCVVIGGGMVAERKVLGLLRAGAQVTVISPDISPRLASFRDRGMISHKGCAYRRGDLRAAFLAVAATGSAEINSRIAADATRSGTLLNVVDVPSLCTFIVPSVFRRGALTIAISTGGVSPALSKTIRKELEQLYGPLFGEYLDFLKGVRRDVLSKVTNSKRREGFLKGLAGKEMLSLVRRESMQEIREAVRRRRKQSGM